MSRTGVSIRGWLTYSNSGSAADIGQVRVVSKILVASLLDSGGVSDDTKAIDTHEEDIAWRQLWTYSTLLESPAVILEGRNLTIEVNVKVKFKLPNDGKHALVMMTQSDVVNRATLTGYLRVLAQR